MVEVDVDDPNDPRYVAVSCHVSTSQRRNYDSQRIVTYF